LQQKFIIAADDLAYIGEELTRGTSLRRRMFRSRRLEAKRTSFDTDQCTSTNGSTGIVSGAVVASKPLVDMKMAPVDPAIDGGY
jgi:hypothetical protein